MNNTFLITILITLLLISSCSSLQKTTNKDLLFELETTSCYGSCPVYTLKIYSGGIAFLEAKEFMDNIGKFSSPIPVNTLNELIKKFDNASFFSLNNSYTSQFTDLPTKYISYYKNGQSKQVLAYDNIPKELNELIKLLENLVKELEWKEVK